MAKPLVIYHASCADGFGAAFAAWKVLGDNADYFAMRYIDADKAPEEQWAEFIRMVPDFDDRMIYVVDFSLPRIVMSRILDSGSKIVWLDHHKTAFKAWLGKYEKGMQHFEKTENLVVRLDDNKSGALIAYEYFVDDESAPPLLFIHLDDYDRWQFKDEHTKAFQKAIWSYAPWTFEQWAEWEYLFDATNSVHYQNFIAEGEAILRSHNQRVAETVKQAATCFISDSKINPPIRGLAVNCSPDVSSDVGHELALKSGTFGLCWYINKLGRAVVSLRSSSDFDVADLARLFGGGGHERAAGFTVDPIRLLGWLENAA